MSPVEIKVGETCATFDEEIATIVIGRSASADVRIDDPRVSRVHAVLTRAGEVWELEDRQSANGTFVLGAAVQRLAIDGPTVVCLADPDDGIPLLVTPGGAVTTTVVSGRHDRPVVRIGRATDNDVVVDDPHVSRYHAELRREDGEWRLCDLNTANGTKLDGRRVNVEPLREDVHVEIGEHVLRVAPKGERIDVRVVAHGRTMQLPAGILGSRETTAEGRHGIATPRERQLLALVAGGATDQQIADELYISISTVRSHLDRIQEKTGLRRRPDLTRLALDLGIAPRRAGE
jgi:pSer/pThr/pTyr-binding forkhead associated (FHA) protein